MIPVGVQPRGSRGSRQASTGPTVWRREAPAHELQVRLEAFRLLQELRLPQLPASGGLQSLAEAIQRCPEAQREELEGHCAPEQLEAWPLGYRALRNTAPGSSCGASWRTASATWATGFACARSALMRAIAPWAYWIRPQ